MKTGCLCSETKRFLQKKQRTTPQLSHPLNTRRCLWPFRVWSFKFSTHSGTVFFLQRWWGAQRFFLQRWWGAQRYVVLNSSLSKIFFSQDLKFFLSKDSLMNKGPSSKDLWTQGYLSHRYSEKFLKSRICKVKKDRMIKNRWSFFGIDWIGLEKAKRTI